MSPEVETLDLADFLGKESLPPSETTKVVTETPAVETPPAEPPVPGEAEVVAPITPPVAKPAPAVDLSDVDESDRPLFSKMANDAKARMVAVYKERKRVAEEYNQKEASLRAELKAAQEKHIPQSYYEHPDAYVLTPEFRQQAELQARAADEHQFWKQQYSKIRRGEQWTDLQVNAQGQVTKVTREPDADSETEVLGYISETQRVANESSAKISQLKSNFSQTHLTSRQKLEEASKRFFPPELQDYQKAIVDNPYAKTMHTALAEINQSRNPLAETVVKLYAIHMDVLNKLVALQKTPTAPVKPNNIRSADIELGKTSQKPTDILDVSEFERAKRQD